MKVIFTPQRSDPAVRPAEGSSRVYLCL